MTTRPALPVLSVGVLITGNLVGAGILALPINTGLSGFGVAVVLMLVFWVLMLTTARILADRVLATRQESFDLPSLFGESLGPAGRWVAVAANLLILYGLMVAYLSGGTAIIASLLDLAIPQWVLTLLFFAFTTGFALFGAAMVRKGNVLLMLGMWGAFLVLILLAAPRITAANLAFVDLALIPSALPIMIAAFHFHNIIPTACRSLQYDRRAVGRALLLGTTLGAVMNGLWVLVALGALPVTGPGERNILHAFDNGLPATVPLSAVIDSTAFTVGGLLFAILAITTSYLTNATALQGFVQDMTGGLRARPSRVRDALITFGPPLVVTLVYPDLFLKALDLVAGVGIALLFGILPGVLLIKGGKTPRARRWGALIVACFLVVLLFEICQEVGVLRIDADAELWKAGLQMTGEHAR